MVWAGILLLGKTKLFITNKTIDSTLFTCILGDYLLPYAHATYGEDFILQQDNCPVHKSTYTNEYLHDMGIETLKWPSKSPDLNPIENLWGILVRMVYQNGNKTFRNKAELKEALLKEWFKICLSQVHS